MSTQPIQHILQRVLDTMPLEESGRAARAARDAASPSAGSTDVVISVNKLTTTAGRWYEKLRYLVDYKDEHTIRRSALERILKRKVLFERKSLTGMTLLEELVRSGYLPNNTVPVELSEPVDATLTKYLTLAADIGGDTPQTALDVYNPLVSLCASEIDRILSPQPIDELVVEAMYETVRRHVVNHTALSDEALNAQLYIACRRTLLADDVPTLTYALFVRALPEWRLTGAEHVTGLRVAYQETMHAITAAVKHPVGLRLTQRLRDTAIYFSFISEIIKRYGTESEQLFTDAKRLKHYIEDSLNEKYERQSKSAQQSGTRAVVYLLLTKMIAALALELPYEWFILKTIDYIPLATNILFHPLVLLVMVRTIRPPDEENTERIVAGVEQMVTNTGIAPIMVHPPKPHSVLHDIFAVMYAALFLVSFGAIIWTLRSLHFNVVSVLLFVFFLAIVSFFGLRIRHAASRWKLSAQDDRTVPLLWSIFTLPLIRTGRWISTTFSSANVLVLMLDFVIETPFKFMLGTVDGFISYLKEKADDRY